MLHILVPSSTTSFSAPDGVDLAGLPTSTLFAVSRQCHL